MACYLADMIDQGRYAEVDALLAQGGRTLRRRLMPGAQSPYVRTRRGTIVIDALTQRLDEAGQIVPKTSWCYPGPDAPLMVSVVITCFNYGRFLPDAIASARAQTLTAREIIIVDDGSTEPLTCELLDRLSHDPDLIVLRQPNQGLPVARNTGIAVARGEYICCLDADDMIEPVYLECAVALLRADSATGFVYPHVQFFGDVNEVWETRDFDISEALIANFTAVCAVFRRDDWHEVGGFSPRMRGGFEDWEFWIRLGTLGRKGRVLRRPLFLHRRHGRTMTHDAKDMSEELRARIRDLNPRAFCDTRLRDRLQDLAPAPRCENDPYAVLSFAVSAPVDRPGLLVVVPWLRRGGAEVLLLNILQELADDWRITILTTEDDPHAMAAAFRDLTLDILHLHGVVDDNDRTDFLRHVVRSRAVSHVLSSGSGWFLSQLKHIRQDGEQRLRVANILHNEVPDSVFRTAVTAGGDIDRYIAVSQPVVRTLLRSGIAQDRVTHIENGIDTAAILAATPQRAEARAAFGVHGEERLLVWIGRFGPEKRPEAFVGIVAALAGTLPVKAIMAGEGPLEAAVNGAIRNAGLGGVIVQLGHCSPADIARLLAAADMLVQTSAVEGMPMVVMEALAAGCMVAATDVGDIRQVVDPDSNGALAHPGRPFDLVPMIAARWHRLGDETLRSDIRKRFAQGPHVASKMAARYRQLLHDL